MRNIEIKVNEDSDLIHALVWYGLSKNKAKTYVKLGFVFVNEVVVKKLPFSVCSGDNILVKFNLMVDNDINIIYEDKFYLIVDKPSGLLSISTSNYGKSREDTLYRRVRYYLNRKYEKAFIVNRIDAETSGLVVFVKNDKLKERLQSNWNQIVKKRGYVAIVSGKISKSGRIDNYLYEDKKTFSHSTKVGGKRAITNYKPIKSNSDYTMLDINIETGRKNQIRVHMMEMNHPIIGDKKYHCTCNPLRRLALHHYEISFIDPISDRVLCFQSKVPAAFYDLF